MQVEHHDLVHEFPDMHDAIAVLNEKNPQFARLYAQYNRLTGTVEDLEEQDMPISDFTLEEMKKRRVRLKDDLYHLLAAFRVGQQHK
jgi:uncharacterized protein YdcH (DUF465 family)